MMKGWIVQNIFPTPSDTDIIPHGRDVTSNCIDEVYTRYYSQNCENRYMGCYQDTLIEQPSSV